MHTGRDVVKHSRGSGTAIHRCVRIGLGSPYGHTSGKRSMVCEGGHAPHQPTGDDRSAECIVSLSDTVSQTTGSIDVRHSHRHFLSDETGRYSLTAYVPTGEGSTSPSTRHTHYASGQTHSGGEECTSGTSLPKRQGGPHGMDVSPDGSGFTVHHVGQTQCGPVCDSSQQQASRVCFTHGRPPSGRCRCHVDIMEGNVCLCIPSICDAGAPHRSPLRVVILIAPKWPNQSWYARLLELMVNFPLVLLLRKDLLTQPHNHLRHLSLQAVCLHTCRLSSDPSKRKDFLTQLPIKYLEGDTSLHTSCLRQQVENLLSLV